MNILFALLVAFSFAAVAAGAFGARKTRQLAKTVSQILEAVFTPLESRYTNIGGLVGYHFVFTVPSPLGEVTGTMTFLPRHTALYLPLSLFVGREDRLSILFRLESSPAGRGHIVDAMHFRHGWITVDDVENMSRTNLVRNGIEFTIFTYNSLVRDRLVALVEKFPEQAGLRHFAYNAADRTVLVEIRPNVDTLLDILNSVKKLLPGFAETPL